MNSPLPQQHLKACNLKEQVKSLGQRFYLCRLYEQKKRGERLSKEERPAPKSKAATHVTDRINKGTHLLGLLSNTRITSSHDSLHEPEEFASANNDDITGKAPNSVSVSW